MDYRKKMNEGFTPKLRRIFNDDDEDESTEDEFDEKNKTKEKNEDIFLEKPTNTDNVDIS